MNVIILGDNHNNTLSLLRSLGEEGHFIFLILHRLKHNYAHKSRYVRKYILIDENDDVIKIIKDVAWSLNSKPALFTCDDYDATLVEDYRKELSEFCYCEGGNGENNINCYRNKDISNNLAEEQGLIIPQNTVLYSSKDISSLSFSYPVMLKANNSIHGGKDVQEICKDYDSLNIALNALPSDSYPVQVQQYIEKEFEIMLQGCSCNGGKEVYCKVANRRIRVYPFIYGACSYGKGVDIDSNEELKALRAKVIAYLRRIGYSGQFSAEFLFYKGTYFFLEVNLRNDGTAYLSTSCGCNLPNIYCNNLAAREIKAPSFKESFYINTVADVHYVIARKLSLGSWIKQLLKADCYSHFNWKDPQPYFYYLYSIIFR